MKRVPCILCAALLMLPFGSVHAADPDDPLRIYQPPYLYNAPGLSIPIGEYVRVSDGRKWEYGILDLTCQDSLVLRQESPDGNEVRLTLLQSSVDELQVRTGTKGHKGLGTLVGIIAGAVIGVAIGLEMSGDTPPSDSGWFVDYDLHAEPFFGGLIGAGIGAGIGGAVGTAARTTEWRDVDLHALGIGALPRPSGQLALGITVPF